MNIMAVFEMGDPILVSVFVILIIMSMTSWYLIFWKLWIFKTEKNNLETFKTNVMQTAQWAKYKVPYEGFGNVSVLIKDVQKLSQSLEHYPAEKRQNLLSMHVSQTLDRIRMSLENSLTILASIGSSAPFIGLFGTVWGIYGALIKISAEGNAGLDVVAAPMGEALVATAVGLFVAIPAVLAYNGFIRLNKVVMQHYRHIAEDLTAYSIIKE